ncbi:MAG TPA: cyclic nucleotide-binding domain-containing protein, partial [Chitinophagaceae bacterium]|nr:cyclic nucleotide-binding domain-containing protein [Chitinophagaceae bacterium]
MSQVFLEYLKKQSGLTDSELEQLQNCVPEKSVRKGEFLLRSGEVCRHTYFVEEGLLRFYSIDESGKD